MVSTAASASADRLCTDKHKMQSAIYVMRGFLDHWGCFLQAQSQKVAKVNELASLRTDLKHERAENMVLREKLCEICLQLDEMATAKEAGEEEHSMTEQVPFGSHLLHCCCYTTMKCISSKAMGRLHSK